MLPPYRKPFLDVPGQLALLRGRGMTVDDPAKAAAYLERMPKALIAEAVQEACLPGLGPRGGFRDTFAARR